MEMPLVSVIVPMYNTEEYVEDLINSIFNQTLANFELIIVNNGSTDDSGAIAEANIPKFGGRLKLTTIPVNNGPSAARNLGLDLSRGEYVFFMDSDDALISNALEKLYAAAKEYHADVVSLKRYYKTSGFGEEFVKNLELHGDPNDNKIELVVEDTYKRLRTWMNNAFEIMPWTKFCRRDFLMENGIRFPSVVQEDSVWTFELICAAKTMLMVPDALYIYRVREESASSVALKREVSVEGVRRKFDRIIRGLKDIDNFMGRQEYFRANPAVRYRTLSQFVTQNLNWIRVASGDTKPYVIYERLREAFSAEMGDYDVLISFLAANNIRLIRELINMRDKLEAAEGK